MDSDSRITPVFKHKILFLVLPVGLIILGAMSVIFQKNRTSTDDQSDAKVSAPESPSDEGDIPMSYRTNIEKVTQENENFRRVLFTGIKSQLVVMSIPPGDEVGEETHNFTEQTLFFVSGTGEGTLDDKKFPIAPGDVVVVTAGTKHNFRNTGAVTLKIYTVYAPPNHIDGRVHQTQADALSDTADEAVGETEPLK